MPTTKFLTASRLEAIKQKVISLQAGRKGYGSELLTHAVSADTDPAEKSNETLDTTVRNIKNASLDFNDFYFDNTIVDGSDHTGNVDLIEKAVDELSKNDEASHGCRGACAGLCTGSCVNGCSGCSGSTAGAAGCGSSSCSGGCRGGCSGVRS